MSLDKDEMNEKDYDPTTAINAANAFFGLAGSFFSEVPDELNATATYCIDKKGQLIAAATNLVFSIELYFKSLTIKTGRPYINTHNLLKLFQNLPEKLQNSIQSGYEERMKQLSLPEGESIALEIWITKEKFEEKQFNKISSLKDPENSIIVLLENEQDAFRTWRYLYEFDKNEKYLKYKLEYKRLCVLANIIQSHIQPY